MTTGTSTNLGAVDQSVNDNTDPNRYFNNYFDPTFTVSPNVDAAILSYFEEVAFNKEAAKALASAVIYTSKSQGVNPMQTLQEFTKLPKGELNSYLVMFLNMQRKGTSYLGITNQPITNKYVNRSILP
jgi:hypothetical protein